MAFVMDIRGVCKAGVTPQTLKQPAINDREKMLAIDKRDGSGTANPNPRTAESPAAKPTADLRVFEKRLVSTGAAACLAGAAGFVLGASNFGGLGFGQSNSPLFVMMAPLWTSSLRFMSNCPCLLTNVRRSLLMLLEYRAEDWPESLDGRSVQPMILTPLWLTISPFLVSSQFPPISEAKSTMTLPGLMDSTISFVMSFGAGLPGMAAVVTIISTSLACWPNSFISASINSLLISLAYPPVPVPSSLTPFTSRNSAPSDSTCSLAAGLVSNALTMAPSDLAVAVAERPATPAPIIRILAGGNLPAAVICPVKNRPKCQAAVMMALQPEILAIEERASQV